MSVELFESAELSDVGRKRKNNEDAFLRLPDRGVYCVADGMGGVAGGDLASEAITTNVHETFANAKPEEYQTLSGTVALLRAAANKASKWIKEFADEKVIGQMGSTFVGLVFDPRNPARARALHAGDSRVYRWREGKIEQLTADHTAARALAAKLGRDPSTFPAKYHNELARAVGLKEVVELEETKVQVRSGDLYMLCCDGLYRMAPDAEIGQVLGRAQQENLGQTAKELINLANEAGGKDNITVVLIKVGDISAVADMEERDTDEGPGTTAATHVPEPEKELKTKEDLNPSTPDTTKPGTAQTARDEIAMSKKAGLPGPARPDVEMRPNRMPWIAGAVVVLAAGVLVFSHYRHKAEMQAGMAEATNANALAATTTNATAPESNATNVTTTEATATNAATPEATASNSTPSSAERPTPPPLNPPTGGFVIQSSPSTADVFSNGMKVGVTPYETNGLPAGQWTYQLGTMTLTGVVVAVVTAGTTNTANVTLTPRMGKLAISSDPANAEVWVDGQAMGKTPASLQLEAGEKQLEIKYPPLADRKMALTVTADQEVRTNALFAYGSVEIRSDPDGAEVRQKGGVVGKTPYATGPLPPGEAEWQLKAKNYTPSNVTVQVPADGSLATKVVKLQRGRGWLQLSVSPEGAQVSLDGIALSDWSPALPVEAGLPHTLKAEYKQERTNATIMVDMDQTNQIVLAVKTSSAPPVAVVPTAAANAAGGGRTWTNKQGILEWTNRQGMAFVKMPQGKFWIQTTRVTPQQFELIAGANSGDNGMGKKSDPPFAFVPLQQARAFAEKLTKELKDKDDLPPGCEQWHLDILTPDQWKAAGDKSEGMGIEMKKLEQSEWASGGTGQDNKAYSCRYTPKKEFSLLLMGPQQAEQEPQAFRLALVE